MSNKNASKSVNDPQTIAEQLTLHQTPDAVDVLAALPSDTIVNVLALLPETQVVEIFDTPYFKAAPATLSLLPLEQAAGTISQISHDRAAFILRHLDSPHRSELLARLTREKAAVLRDLLSYPLGTAGSLMTTEFVSIPDSWKIDEALRHIRGVEHTRESIYAIYLVDSTTGKLVRAASLRRLLSGDPDASVLSVAPLYDPVVVDPMADREDVARLITKYDLLAVPVVDPAGQILGIVTVDDIMDVMIEEATEDTQKFGGMGPTNGAYLDIGFLAMIKKRGGWLAALFMGEMLTASAMQHYEADIANAVVLTLFIPLIMSSGGNSGSQATSLIIRALALDEVRLGHWWKVALRELPIGITLGVILGAIGVTRIAVWQMAGFYDYGEYWILIAATVGTALVAIVTFGSLVGSLLPFGLKALRFDPASASAPFVATLVDVSGIVIYFSIALAFLSGKLL